MSDYGIPYMGSKAKIAPSLCMMLPNAEHFYDLFGGGFSMTHCMMNRFHKKYSYFHYNEIKSDVVDLVKRAINGEFNYSVFKPKWVSRDDFFAKKDSDAYIRCIWSFGNNQKNYLFGDIEPFKRAAHQAVVFGEFDDAAIKILGFDRWPNVVKTIKQRRIYWRQKVAFNSNGMKRGDLQQLERLEQLERLQQSERLQQLSFYAKSYDEINILPNSVVYCDIPYEGTRDYGKFDRKKFLDWAASRKFPVYVSEYNIIDDRFKQVYSIDKRSMLAGGLKGDRNKSEKLYWNGSPCGNS
jgi:site-specific DNA-adenine methylase